MPLLVGTSGWQYKDWRGVLYPPGLPVRLWLEEYAAAFPTVEVNNAFYRLPPGRPSRPGGSAPRRGSSPRSRRAGT